MIVCVYYIHVIVEKNYAFLTCQLVRITRSIQVQVEIQVHSSSKSRLVQVNRKTVTGNSITGIETGILEKNIVYIKEAQRRTACFRAFKSTLAHNRHV